MSDIAEGILSVHAREEVKLADTGTAASCLHLRGYCLLRRTIGHDEDGHRECPSARLSPV